MLQIRLKRDPSTEISGAARPSPVETVTVACPDHLVLADLPVAKGIGSVTAASVVKTVGRRSRRQLGERVHFCVRCDFPIAVYGRLSPCEHAFCLECARSDSICYLCDERVQKIQTIKMMEGIFICAAPHCLKSFMNKTGFESHIHENHSHLLHPNMERDDGNDSDNKQSSASESTLRGPSRPAISPGSGVQQQFPPRHMMTQLKGQPGYGQVQNHLADSQADNSRPPGFDRPIPPLNQFPEYPPVNSMHPPNFAVTMNQNHLGPPPAYNFPPYQTDGTQPFYNAHYEMPRSEAGSEQGSLLGFPPGVAAGNPNFPGTYASQTWNPGMAGMSFESQGNNNLGGSNNIDPRGGRSSTSSQPMQAPPQPPLPPPHASQQHMNRGQFYSGDMGGRDVQSHGWQHENRDGYGGSQE